MTRAEEFAKVKALIKENYRDGCCGLFDCWDIFGDTKEILLDGQYIQLYICRYWAYFEVFGLHYAEWKEVCELYEALGKRGKRK